MQIKNSNELKSKLYWLMESYGNTDPRTVAVSQELDKIIVIQQQDLNYGKA